MARTLEIEEEESRIEELERLLREGDETDKMIAEVQLAEERKRVANERAATVQEEELTPPVTPSDAVLALGKRTEKEASEGIVEDIKALPFKKGGEMKLEDMPEMEEQFTKRELALHKASEEAKLQKALDKVTGKAVDDWTAQRERLRKNLLEKYPKATFGQRLQEGLTLGLFSPATKANVESATAVGAAMAEFDARTKLNNATSSAKSARIGAAIGGGETKAIVDVMTGMSDNANLKYFNEVRAKSGSFFKNFLNVGPDATPAQEKAAQERVIWLARQGNETANLQLQALASQYNSFAAARKLTVTSERAAAQRRSDKLWADAVAAQQLHATNLGEGAVDENGIYQESSLPPHVRESMLDENGKLNLFGYHVRAGGSALINEDNKAIRTQIRDNRSESKRIAYQEASVLGSTIVDFDSRPLDQKISLTNRKNLDDRMKRLETTREYTAAMQGEPPESIKNNINFRNSLLKQRTDIQKELEGVDRFSERGRDLGFALGRINRGIFEADGEINTAFAGMASATRRITEGEKTEEEFQKARQLEDARLGQQRMDAFRKLINVDELEAKATGHQTEGIGAGGGFFEFAFFKQDGKGGYSDVKDVFRPWLDTHTLASRGGIPFLGGFLPDDLTKKSNAYVFKPDDYIDPKTNENLGADWPDDVTRTGRFVRDWTNEAQRIVYDGALDQWADEYGQFKKQEPEVEEFGEGMTGEEGMEQPPELTARATPAAVTPVQPTAVTPPVVTNYPASWSTPLEVEPPAWPRPPAGIEEATNAKDVEVMRAMILEYPVNPDTKKPWMLGDRMKYLGRDYLFYGGDWNLE